MRILLIGDSITDMRRDREADFSVYSYGSAYPFFIQGELGLKYPKQNEVINRGISGNRVVDVYARIKKDCWNLQPDLISVLIGVNDVWHEIYEQNGVDLARFEKVYRMMIEDTKKALSNVKFVLLEPFVLRGKVTEERYDEFLQVKEYAKAVKRIAADEGCYFVPLQEKFDRLAERDGAAHYLPDGVHPSVVGAKVIADEWLSFFESTFLK